MKFDELIEVLKQKQIEVFLSSGKLKYKGPEENISPELVGMLTKYKGKLIKHFWPVEFSNLVPINTDGNKLPVFIVHGDNFNYLISDHLGKSQPVYGFFHPGSEGESIPFKSVEEMAESYLNKLLTLCPAGPYNLIGYCFGGVLAFEMAVQLQKLGHMVSMLVLIDSQSPMALEPIEWQKGFYNILKKNIISPVLRRVEIQSKLLVCTSYILRKKLIPPNYRKLYILGKYAQLNIKYKPAAKFTGDILLFRASNNMSSYKYLGWDVLSDNIKLITVEADHTSIIINKVSMDVLNTEIEKQLLQVQTLHSPLFNRAEE